MHGQAWGFGGTDDRREPCPWSFDLYQNLSSCSSQVKFNMARYNEFAGPKLPTQLLEKVYGGKVDKHGKQESSRKEKRKAERQSKKKVPLRTKKPVKWQAQQSRKEESESEDEDEEDVKPKSKSAVPAKDAKPVKSILKTRPSAGKVVEVVKPVEVEVEDEDDDEEEEETDINLDDEEEEEEEDGDSDNSNESFTISREAAKAKLNDDDDVIAALERKLGIKGGKKSSKAVTEDEWDFLMNGDLGEDGEDDEEDEEEALLQSNGKRKRGQVEGKSAADDAWLESKRKKARGEEKKGEEKRSKGEKKSKVTRSDMMVDAESEDEQIEPTSITRSTKTGDDDMDGLANPFSDDEMSADDFDEYEDSEDDDAEDDEPEASASAPPPRKRENPYIAPITDSSTPTQKYIPPSLRQPSTSDEEILKNLRRQVQGQLNRLSEANLPSILSTILELYSSNARQHVTSVLISLLTNLISDPSVLTDTFLILHAGFSTALYRSLGPDFGAPLLESLVQAFDTHYSSTETTGKQPLNLLAFLSTMYTLQSISHNIIFDYIRLLLSTFSESSTELLLRIIRISGPQLRSDDPSSLKDIVLILQRETAKLGGEANLSVRTKFMTETILNLKNNRVKTGVAAKALSAEHMLRMKKILGGIKGAKTTEPLRITLEDIRDSEKKGKWWLVGASWKDPLKHTTTSSSSLPIPAATTAGVIAGDEDDEGRDLESLARSQGMNTSIRSAIFIAITGALDFQHAQLRLGKLSLKKKQMGEIPRVLVHCVAMEGVYNHFYTLVAYLYAGDVAMKRAWGGVLMDVLRRLEDGEEEGGQGEKLGVKQVYCVAKMYAGLISEGLLRVTVLKNLDFADLSSKGRIFVQVLFATIFVQLRKKAAGQVGKGKGEEHKVRKEEVFEGCVREVLEQAHAVPDMVLGMKFVVEKVVRGSEVLGKGDKERGVVEGGCEVVMRVLSEVPRKRVEFEGRDGGDSDGD